MEYTITINQKAIVEAGLLELGVDMVDSAILSWSRNYRASNGSEKMEIDGVLYVWISHTKVIEELPLLGINSARGIRKRMAKLADSGLLILHPNCKNLKRSYYAFSPLAESLFGDFTRNSRSRSLGTAVPSHKEQPFRLTRNSCSMDHNTIDHYTNDHRKSIKRNSSDIEISNPAPEIPKAAPQEEAPATKVLVDPSEVIKEKILSASQQVKDVWMIQQRIQASEIAALADEYAAWWIGKQEVSDYQLSVLVKKKGSISFQQGFRTSLTWLKERMKKNNMISTQTATTQYNW